MRPFDELLPCATRNIKHSAQAQCVIVLSSVTKTIICEALREPSPDAWDREPGTCVTIASPQSPSLSRRRRQWEGGREGEEEFGGSSISPSPRATSNRHEWTVEIQAVILPLEYTRTPYSNVVMVEE